MTTVQKALAINLDGSKYGTIVEIGAGQEVARYFFRAGGAAGTIAKTMSAYDMQFSDAIYGEETSGRYVSRSRLEKMLEKEFGLVLERLAESRSKNSTYFAYAATVATKSYSRKSESHGWIGVRLQLYPKAEPSDIVLHVRMLDKEAPQQQEALGILGVNLIYAAYHHYTDPKRIIDSLAENIGSDRIEVDVINFSGPYFEEVENRLMNLHLIRAWLTRAVMFSPSGSVEVPAELLYKKNLLVMRGAFKPVTTLNMDMIEGAQKKFMQADGVSADNVVRLAEITMATLVSGDTVDDSDFLARVDLMTALGFTVLISDYLRYFSLRAYFRRYTKKQIGIVMGISNVIDIFDERYYVGLEGGILEAFGKLFPDNTRLYVYPSYLRGDSLTTLDNLDLGENHQHLFRHLVQNKLLIPLEVVDEGRLHIYQRDVLQQIQNNSGQWEKYVPEVVAQQIIDRKLLGYDSN